MDRETRHKGANLQEGFVSLADVSLVKAEATMPGASAAISFRCLNLSMARPALAMLQQVSGRQRDIGNVEFSYKNLSSRNENRNDGIKRGDLIQN